jgi:hypothetical protein
LNGTATLEIDHTGNGDDYNRHSNGENAMVEEGMVNRLSSGRIFPGQPPADRPPHGLHWQLRCLL